MFGFLYLIADGIKGAIAHNKEQSENYSRMNYSQSIGQSTFINTRGLECSAYSGGTVHTTYSKYGWRAQTNGRSFYRCDTDETLEQIKRVSQALMLNGKLTPEQTLIRMPVPHTSSYQHKIHGTYEYYDIVLNMAVYIIRDKETKKYFVCEYPGGKMYRTLYDDDVEETKEYIKNYNEKRDKFCNTFVSDIVATETYWEKFQYDQTRITLLKKYYNSELICQAPHNTVVHNNIYDAFAIYKEIWGKELYE